MKHWDLIPGETVTLTPGGGESPDARGVEAVFRFRTTLLACFDVFTPPGETYWLEAQLTPDGALQIGRRVWHIRGRDRNTRIVIEQPLGKGRHFTSKAGG